MQEHRNDLCAHIIIPPPLPMGWGGGNENSTRYAGRAQLTLQEAYLPTLPITAKCITLNLL